MGAEERPDTVTYIERVMELYNEDKVEEAEAYREEYADAPVTLGDVEEAVAYVLTNLSLIQLTREKFVTASNDMLLDLLHKKEVITQEEKDNLEADLEEMNEELKEIALDD